MRINLVKMVTFSFTLCDGLAVSSRVSIVPIMFPSYNVEIMLRSKGFIATNFGSLGSALGAIIGRLLIDLIEPLGEGYYLANAP